MKFETTPAFDSDYRRLMAEHSAADFKKAVRKVRWCRVGDHDVFKKPLSHES